MRREALAPGAGPASAILAACRRDPQTAHRPRASGGTRSTVRSRRAAWRPSTSAGCSGRSGSAASSRSSACTRTSRSDPSSSRCSSTRRASPRAIHHPNVVATLDVVDRGERALPRHGVRARRPSLSSLLHRGRPRRASRSRLPSPPAIMAGVLAGLHAAHEAATRSGEPLDIVHRDVSPQNILVGTDGVARDLDFGVAKAAGRLQTHATASSKASSLHGARAAPGRRGRSDAPTSSPRASCSGELAGRRLFRGDDTRRPCPRC